MITALSHFILTYEGIHKDAVGWEPKIGRWMILLALGASFGNAIMTRFAIYQRRFIFLPRDAADYLREPNPLFFNHNP